MVIFGGIVVFIKPRMAWIHLPMVLWSAIVNLMGWICPLTPLENYYRNASGQAEYDVGFLEQHLSSVIYPEFADFQLGIFLGLSIFFWNLLIYTLVIYKIRTQ